MICLSLASCALGSRDDRPVLVGGGASLSAFEATVYPLVRSSCAECHGNGQTPLFAVQEVEQAYSRTLVYVDSDTPIVSRLAQYAGNQHCGAKCNDEKRSELVAALTAWLDQGGGQPGVRPTHFGKLTELVDLPDLSGGEQTLTYDLAHLGEEFEGASFSIKVAEFGAGIYRFFEPRFSAGVANLLIQDVRILVNDTYNPANSLYRDIDSAMAAGDSGFISVNEMLVVGQDAQTDAISIAFGTLEEIAGCKAQSQFSSSVNSIMGRCTGCHDSSRNTFNFAAVRAWDVGTSRETRCIRLARRINAADPVNSTIIQYPLIGTPMNTSPRINQSQADTILSWINAELQ